MLWLTCCFTQYIYAALIMKGGFKVEIQVCIGSACHVKGSYDIINELNSLISENQLTSSVKVQVAFCLGVCKEGVTIKVGERLVTGVSMSNVRQVFDTYVIGGAI